MDRSECKRLLVAAFDFGTTYSGYAFSFRNDPNNVKTNQNWVAGSEKLISLKTPTCVLLTPNKEFHSFGFTAENKYSELAEDGENQGWYFFRRFKMILHKSSELSRDMQIEDIRLKPMRAMTVFALSIKFLKDHLLEALSKQMSGIKIADIEFVITVPAIWDDKAKQFMREAAREAGIPDEQLHMALEPEAASMHCQTISTQIQQCSIGDSESKYMVVDLGGGTADITVHERIANGTLRELHKASGGAWGGNEVDKAYLQMLTTIVGRDTMSRFKAERMGDYIDILREFETKKRTIMPDKMGKLTFKMSASMKEMFEENGKSLKNRIEKSSLNNKLTWMRDKFRVEMEVARGWFRDPIQSLIRHVQGLLKKPQLQGIEQVLLVGGFGECELVHKAFRDQIQECQLIIPEDAGLAVLKGAVSFGHCPKLVSSRIACFSYGVAVTPEFVKGEHLEEKKFFDGNIFRCKDIYYEMVEIGEELETGRTFEPEGCFTGLPTQSYALVKIFRCMDNPVEYITDTGCEKLGEIRIDFPEKITVNFKEFRIIFIFGETELRVKVVLVPSGKEYQKFVNCF